MIGNRTLVKDKTMEHCNGKGSHCDGAVNQVKVATCYEKIYH